MRTIHKYPLAITDTQVLMLPRMARLLSVQWQNGELCLWALVTTEAVKEPRTIRILGTGNPIEEMSHELRFVGTVQEPDRPLVWHIFEGVQA